MEQKSGENMTAREYLQQLHRVDVIIKQKIQEKNELQTMSTNIGGFDYSKEKVQASLSASAPYAKAINKMLDLEEEIDGLLEEFWSLKHEIIGKIHGLQNATYIGILYKRYVEDKRLEVIAVEMNFTYQYTRALHGYALQEFERTYTNLHRYALI